MRPSGRKRKRKRIKKEETRAERKGRCRWHTGVLGWASLSGLRAFKRPAGAEEGQPALLVLVSFNPSLALTLLRCDLSYGRGPPMVCGLLPYSWWTEVFKLGLICDGERSSGGRRDRYGTVWGASAGLLLALFAALRGGDGLLQGGCRVMHGTNTDTKGRRTRCSVDSERNVTE